MIAASSLIEAPFLRTQNLSKTFNQTKVLKKINLTLLRSEVHALVGENGAGKSTLIKILAGVLAPDAKTTNPAENLIYLNELECNFKNPRDAINHKIAVIFQERALIECLSVYDNLVLAIEDRQLNVRKILQEIGLENLPLNQEVARLSLAQKQQVEVAKAYLKQADLFIFDEPTTCFNEQECEQLLQLIKKLQLSGKAILYVTHKLDEVFQIAQVVTVLRDGEKLFTRPTNLINKHQLIQAMTQVPVLLANKVPNPDFKPRPAINTDPVWQITQPFDLTMYPGDVFGLTGLQGSGVFSMMHELYTKQSPQYFIKNKIILVGEDRKNDAIIPCFSGLEQITLTKNTNYFLNFNQDQQYLNYYKELFQIKLTNQNQSIELLSGGNQQKIILAQALAANPKLLILCEPTRGIDIRARQKIYQVLKNQCAQGLALLIVSTDLNELFELCSKIAVFADRKLVGWALTQKTKPNEILQMGMRH